MQVHVKITSGKTFTFDDLENSATISQLKSKVESTLEDMPYQSQRMSYAGQELDDDSKTFSDYKIGDGATVFLLKKLT
ncbi:hypothetical protein EMPS_06863 [Entomortierella parvispora]|uniref:Ubiquitin-like domain-containing protein n=1 Tax=Entomortierella parvispora TaxID=205924 RepID=A0A9P3HD30_9FUNG|nr:hypothetical protein EMPS_06863 [Entomortierella parvispora]